MRNRSRSHAALSNPRTSRPAFFARDGWSAASACRSASASLKSRAFSAIIQCSAVAYDTPDTVNGDGHH